MNGGALPDPTPRDVILAALVHPPPPQEVDPRPDIEWRADLIEQSLRAADMLPPVEPKPITKADLIDLAKWLAEESRHPRYTVVAQDGYPAGWERLYGPRSSEADVTVAYNAAVKGSLQADRIQQLQRARDVLVRHIGTHDG